MHEKRIYAWKTEKDWQKLFPNDCWKSRAAKVSGAPVLPNQSATEVRSLEIKSNGTQGSEAECCIRSPLPRVQTVITKSALMIYAELGMVWKLLTR